ncbi:hypothetical protein Hanom_Chr09g00787461 [Helianthus anomalus]
MYEIPTRAVTFSEGILAMGGLSPSYPVRPKAFCWQKSHLWCSSYYRVNFLEVASRRFQGCQIYSW